MKQNYILISSTFILIIKIKQNLHKILKHFFKIDKIHSMEYNLIPINIKIYFHLYMESL